MNYKCPKCGNLVEEGTSPCPTCGQVFNWPKKDPEPVAPPVVPVVQPEPPVEQPVQQPVVNDEPAAQAFPNTQPAAQTFPAAQPTTSYTPAQEKKKGGKAKKGCLGCGLVLFIFFILIILIALISGGGSSTGTTTTTTAKATADTIVGTWRAPAEDYTSAYADDSLAPDVDMLKYVDTYYATTAYEYPIMLYTEITFNSDGTYSWQFSKYGLDDASEAYANGLYKAYYQGIEKYDSSNGYSRDIDAFLTEKGFTKDFMASEFIDMFETITPFQTGTWEFSDGYLIVTNSKTNNTTKSQVSMAEDGNMIIGDDLYTHLK